MLAIWTLTKPINLLLFSLHIEMMIFLLWKTLSSHFDMEFDLTRVVNDLLNAFDFFCWQIKKIVFKLQNVRYTWTCCLSIWQLLGSFVCIHGFFTFSIKKIGFLQNFLRRTCWNERRDSNYFCLFVLRETCFQWHCKFFDLGSKLVYNSISKRIVMIISMNGVPCYSTRVRTDFGLELGLGP